jgi:hypothetical protein
MIDVGAKMKEKEIAQKILAMYLSQESEEGKKQFLKLLKEIIKIIETMNKEDFEKFVDDFENHLNKIDEIKKTYGINI